MRTTKRLALTLAIAGAAAMLPVLAQGGPNPNPRDADVSIDLDAAGLAPPGGPPPGMMMPPPPGENSMDDDDLLAMGPPGGPGNRVFKYRMMGGPGRGPGGPFAGLNLTDDQLEKMFALRRDNAGKEAAKMGEMMQLHMQMEDAMLQPEIDRAKVMALQARMNAIHTEMSTFHLENKLAAMAILTPDQRRELRRNMLQRMAGGGRRGGPPCPPGECGPEGGPHGGPKR